MTAADARAKLVKAIETRLRVERMKFRRELLDLADVSINDAIDELIAAVANEAGHAENARMLELREEIATLPDVTSDPKAGGHA